MCQRYVGYKDMREYIRNSIPFIGSSVVATTDEEGNYLVYSYNTLIYNSKEGYFNSKKYSSTTSKLQNIIREVRL